MRIRSWKKRGNDVFVYFDNDQKSAAPADALKLRQILVQERTVRHEVGQTNDLLHLKKRKR
jgi:uncharacterized protein YecE (DUF72 family)